MQEERDAKERREGEGNRTTRLSKSKKRGRGGELLLERMQVAWSTAAVRHYAKPAYRRLLMRQSR